MDKKWDENRYPLHMRKDVWIRNQNIDLGFGLCDRCEGTGNELYSMWKKCINCKGTGQKA